MATKKPISSRELIKRCGGDPDAPFERGPFPPEMRQFPARDGIEAMHGLNDIYPGDPYPPMPHDSVPVQTPMSDHINRIVAMLVGGEHHLTLTHPNPAVGSSHFGPDIAVEVGRLIARHRPAPRPAGEE